MVLEGGSPTNRPRVWLGDFMVMADARLASLLAVQVGRECLTKAGMVGNMLVMHEVAHSFGLSGSLVL